MRRPWQKKKPKLLVNWTGAKVVPLDEIALPDLRPSMHYFTIENGVWEIHRAPGNWTARFHRNGVVIG